MQRKRSNALLQTQGSKFQKNSFSQINFFELKILFYLQGCACFPEFLQNFSECQIVWSLSSVVFHALTLKLPIQTSLSVAPDLIVSFSSAEFFFTNISPVWHLIWVQNQGRSPCLHIFVACLQRIPQIHLCGATPGDLLVASMAAGPFRSTYSLTKKYFFEKNLFSND